MGSATIEGRIDMGEKVIVNIRTFMDGHKPPDRVLPSMLERSARDSAAGVHSGRNRCRVTLRR